MDNPRRPPDACLGFVDHDHSKCLEAVLPSSHDIPKISGSRLSTLNAGKQATDYPSKVLGQNSPSRIAKNQDKKLRGQSSPSKPPATVTSTPRFYEEKAASSTGHQKDTDGQKTQSEALIGSARPEGVPRPPYFGHSNKTQAAFSNRSQPFSSIPSQSGSPPATISALIRRTGLVESQALNSMLSSSVPSQPASMHGKQSINDETPSNSGNETPAADYRILFPGFSLMASEWGSRSIPELEADLESYYQRHPSMLTETAVDPTSGTQMSGSEVEEVVAFLLTWRQYNARKYQAQALAQNQGPTHCSQTPSPPEKEYPPQPPPKSQRREQPIEPSPPSNTYDDEYGAHIPTLEPPTYSFGNGPPTAMPPLAISRPVTLPTASPNRAQRPEQRHRRGSNASMIPQRPCQCVGDAESERQQYPQPLDMLNMIQQILTYRDFGYEAEEVASKMEGIGYPYMTAYRIKHYFEFYRQQSLWVNGVAFLPPF